MKAKRKIVTIWIVSLFFASMIVTVQAGKTSDVSNEESIYVEIDSIASDGSIITKMLQVTEDDLAEFETAITSLMSQIESIQDWNTLRELIERFFRGNSAFGGILGTYASLKLLKNKALVVSNGHYYNFDFIRKSSIKIRNKMQFWHYVDDSGILRDKTIIIQPFSLKRDILRGKQFGFMRGFTGIYINIYRGFGMLGHTYFIGIAKNARGFDIPRINTNPQSTPVTPVNNY